MRIISWNVNGLKSHLKPEKWQYLNDLIKNYDPDILLMQETKLSENDELYDSELLFTQMWDISYAGLTEEETHEITIDAKNSGEKYE